MRSSLLLLGSLLLPALAGCATVRSDFTPANGEKLTVYDKAIQREGIQQVRTGEDQIRDADGRIIATNTRFQDKEIHWTEHDWYPLQGGNRIDDESFYRIAGDTNAVETYNKYHADGAGTNTTGAIFTAIGLGLVGAGIVGYALDHEKTDPVTFHTTGGGIHTLGAVGMGLGGFVTIGGLIALFGGKSKAENRDRRLFDDPQRARAAARKYNDTLAPAEAPPAREPPPAAKEPPAAKASVDPDQYAQQLDANAPAECSNYIVLACGKTHGSRGEREAECGKILATARKAAATRAPAKACGALLHNLPK